MIDHETGRDRLKKLTKNKTMRSNLCSGTVGVTTDLELRPVPILVKPCSPHPATCVSIESQLRSEAFKIRDELLHRIHLGTK